MYEKLLFRMCEIGEHGGCGRKSAPHKDAKLVYVCNCHCH